MSTASRAARNESLFREVNEAIEDLQDELGGTNKSMEFICECSRSDCTVRLEVKQDEYAAVRAKPTHFLVHHGHEDLRFERVVRTTLQYLVVEKTGEAGEVAEAES